MYPLWCPHAAQHPLLLPSTGGCPGRQVVLAGSWPHSCKPWLAALEGWGRRGAAAWVWRQERELGEVFTRLPGKGRVQQAASRSRTQPGQHCHVPLPPLHWHARKPLQQVPAQLGAAAVPALPLPTRPH